MSKLNNPIPVQAYELIRDQIGIIITDELANQYVLTSDEDLNITNIFSERFITFDKSELTAINISLQDGNYDAQDSIETDAHYTFNIDVEVAAKSSELLRGDIHSRQKLHKIIGKIRAILMAPAYQTLGFEMPFISNRKINSIQNDTTMQQRDAINSSFGRLILEVKTIETAELIQPVIAAGYDTEVKISLTDKGFKYVFNN